jgi:hypothetical protein
MTEVIEGRDGKRENGDFLVDNTSGSSPVFEPQMRGPESHWQDRIKMVGTHWQMFNNLSNINFGQGIANRNHDNSAIANVDEYIEVTFYGTGISILSDYLEDQHIFDVTVDGVLNPSGTLSLRRTDDPTSDVGDWSQAYHQYKAIPIPGANSLTQGIHTVRLTISGSTPTGSETVTPFYGFDIYNLNPVRLPGRAVINGEVVEYDSVESVTLPSGGRKGKRAKYYLDPEDGVFKWSTTQSGNSVQTGTIDLNGGGPDQITGLSDPSQYYNTTDSVGNIVLITDTVTGSQKLGVPTGISGGALQFADGAFSSVLGLGEPYGFALTDTNACEVELWGKSMFNADLDDHDTLIEYPWHAFNQRSNRTNANTEMRLMDDGFTDSHDSMHDNHTAITTNEMRIDQSGTTTQQAQVVLDGSDSAAHMRLSFIGTGFALTASGSTNNLDIFVDGVKIITGPLDDQENTDAGPLKYKTFPIVGDLPFGSHHVVIKETGGGGAAGIGPVFQALSPLEPSMPSNAIPIAETYIMPDTNLTDLDLETQADRSGTRMGTAVEKAGIEHLAWKEVAVYANANQDVEATFSAAGYGGRPNRMEMDNHSVNDEFRLTFYGTECGIWLDPGSSTVFPDIDVYVDGVLVLNNYDPFPLAGDGDDLAMLKLTGFTEGPHHVRIVFVTEEGSAAQDSPNIAGFVDFGRQTFYPYKPRYLSRINRALNGNSSWRDLRPITPSADILYEKQLPLNSSKARQASLDTAFQSVFGSANMARAGNCFMHYSETGVVDLQWMAVFNPDNANSAEFQFDIYMDGSRLLKRMAGFESANDFEWEIETSGGWGPGNEYTLPIFNGKVHVGKGWHCFSVTGSCNTDPGSNGVELRYELVTIADVRE